MKLYLFPESVGTLNDGYICGRGCKGMDGNWDLEGESFFYPEFNVR